MYFPMLLVYMAIYATLGEILGIVLGFSGAERVLYIVAVTLASLMLGAVTSAKFHESNERCG